MTDVKIEPGTLGRTVAGTWTELVPDWYEVTDESEQWIGIEYRGRTILVPAIQVREFAG